MGAFIHVEPTMQTVCKAIDQVEEIIFVIEGRRNIVSLHVTKESVTRHLHELIDAGVYFYLNPERTRLYITP